MVDNNLDPVVQSIVSLTISLRRKFVKQISAKVTNTLRGTSNATLTFLDITQKSFN